MKAANMAAAAVTPSAVSLWSENHFSISHFLPVSLELSGGGLWIPPSISGSGHVSTLAGSLGLAMLGVLFGIESLA
jgi:hypothetical protein